MSDPLGDFNAEVKRNDRAQTAQAHRLERRSGFLDRLSGFLGAGTLGAGLFFAIVFISPQNRIALLPTTVPEQNLTFSATSTFQSGLPPTWTPTISPTLTPTPTESPSLTPSPTDTTEAVTSHSQIADTDPGDMAVYVQEVDLSMLVDKPPQANQESSGPAAENQLAKDDDYLVSPQMLMDLMQPQDVENISAQNPEEQNQAEYQESELGISDLFTPEIQYWEEEILAWGEEYDLDPNLIATVMQIESCGYTRAKSVAGAMGLFQVMPHHFKKNEQPYDLDTNAFRGLSWLQKTVRSSDSIAMALAGYNAGIARVKNPYLKWPAETERYVDWGENIYQDAIFGYETSSALQHWLSKGGSALCNRAAEEQRNKQ